MTNHIHCQSFIQNLLYQGSKLNDRPLFNQISKLDLNQELPRRVIGDPDRFEQMAINIITNSIQNTGFEGHIMVYTIYNQKA